MTPEEEPDGSPSCRLYLVTPPAFDPEIFAPEMSRALGAGDVAAFQLRLEKASDDQWKHAIDVLMPVAQDHGAAFLLDARADLAREMDTDGVHLGPRDMRVADARKILGPDRTIGACCWDSKHLAMTAAEQGADYISFGAFFPANAGLGKPAPPDLIGWWSELMEAPCVAGGGLTPANCGALVKAGADFICASTSVWTHPDGAAAAVRDFLTEIARASD